MGGLKAWFKEIEGEVPKLPKPVNVIFLIACILLPGCSVITATFLADNFKPRQIGVGMLQSCLTYLIVGWIWSIYWGILILKKGG